MDAQKAWAWRCVLGAALTVAACGGTGDPNALRNGSHPVTDRSSTSSTLAGETPYDDTRALAWLSNACASCHGVDPNTGTPAQYYSAWPMPASGLTHAFLETDELTSVVYQTIRNAAASPRGVAPSPMPPQELDDAHQGELRGMLDWFGRSLPFAVIDADQRYGNADPANAASLVKFVCGKPSTLRQYLARTTLGAFDRGPTVDELGAFSEADLAGPVTQAQRDATVARFDGDWRQELLDVGLRKLATVIGGAPGIKPNQEVAGDVIPDLQDELYQSFLAHYDASDYADYFTANTVMASPNTAGLYSGCSVDTGWKECKLMAPRGGFFTTLGFLNSRPSSFMLENNNYGRVAATYFTLYGEQLLAATGGPTGAAIPDLPSCLEQTDTRFFNEAPRGAAAVPESGKVCQSCHVSRHMAAGAIVFRPFSTTGQIYGVDTLGTDGSSDSSLYYGAILPSWTHHDGASETPVDADFLLGLLGAPPKSCMATGRTDTPFVSIANVADLAKQLMANTSSFSRGFMRHAQRAFANLTSITLEMGLRSLTAFDAKKTKLPDLIKAYFGSDSFACEGEQ